MTAKLSNRQSVSRNISWTPVVVLVFFSIFFLSSCSKKVPVVPALTQDSTEERLVGKFVWYDLFVHNLESVTPFYKEIFGWSFVNTEPDKDRVKTIYRNGAAIGNAVQIDPQKGGEKKKKKSSYWLGYLSVENVDATSIAATKYNASIHMKPKDLPNRGRVAIIKDPQGAHVALVTGSTGDPPDSDKIDNLWVGSELWTSSVDDALKFYTPLFDYEVETVPMNDGFVYTILVKNDKYRAAIVKIPWEDEIKPQWIPYVAVNDITEIISKVESLGGTIHIDADPETQNTPNAIIGDPQGAVFGILEIGGEQP